MKKILFVLLLLLSVDVFAGYYSAGKLYGYCTNEIWDGPGNTKFGACVGYLVGVADLAERSTLKDRICKPDSVKIGQLKKIFTKYIDDNPQQMHLDASSVVERSIYKAFNRQGKLQKSINLSTLLKNDQPAPEPVGLWLEDDTLYWSDRANHQICQMRWSQQKLIRCFGRYGEAKGQFRFPFQLATDRDGYLHSVDVLNARVLIFNSRGKAFSQVGRFGVGAGELFRPNGIAIDDSDYIFVSDSYLGHISIFKSGRFIAYLMDKNNKPIQFETPIHLSLKNNQLLVVDAMKNSVTQLELSYELVTNTKTSKRHKKITKALSSRRNCIACHLSWEDKGSVGLLSKKQSKVLPVASEKMCYSCHHGAVVESRLAMREQHQHSTIYSKNDKKLVEREDKIPPNFPLTEGQQLLCSSCHSPHNNEEDQEVLYTGHKNSWMRVANRGGNLCERCHESKAIGARYQDKKDKPAITVFNHPLAIRFAPAPSKNSQDCSSDDSNDFSSDCAKNFVKETHLKKGLPEELTANGAVLDKQQQMICQTCHQIHAGQEKDLLSLSNVHSELCISCHQSKYAKGKEKAHQQGIHPVNIKLEKVLKYQGKNISQVNCGSCHEVHNGAPSTALLPQELAKTEDELCLACHKDNYSNTPDEAHRKGIHPANFKLEKPLLQEGKKIHEVNCSSCHSMHAGRAETALFPKDRYSKKTRNKQQALCISCHQQQYAKDKMQARAKGIHPVNIKLEEKIEYQGKIIHEVTCATCHKVHNGKQNSALLMQADDEIEQLCIVCHQRHNAQNRDEALEKGVHLVNQELKEAVTINDKKIERLTCLSCHSVHQGKKHTAALVQSDQDGELCKNCHKEQQKVLKTDHDLRITAKEKKNHHGKIPEEVGLCANCHSMHRGHSDKNQFPFLYAAKTLSAREKQKQEMDKVLLTRDQLCINCHQEDGLGKEKIVNHFSHPYQDLILRSDSKQMPLLKKSDANTESSREKIHEFGIIACITCHNPHVWQPEGKEKTQNNHNENIEGNSKNSFLRQADVAGTFCVSCHGIEARLKYKYYHDKLNARGIGVEYLK